jgi:hypothetical protein
VFSEIDFHVPEKLRLRQFVGIALFAAGVCVMAHDLVSRIQEVRESSTWSTSSVAPAAITATLYRRV